MPGKDKCMSVYLETVEHGKLYIVAGYIPGYQEQLITILENKSHERYICSANKEENIFSVVKCTESESEDVVSGKLVLDEKVLKNALRYERLNGVIRRIW